MAFAGPSTDTVTGATTPLAGGRKPRRPPERGTDRLRIETQHLIHDQGVTDQANAAADDQLKTGHLRSVVMVALVGFVGQVLRCASLLPVVHPIALALGSSAGRKGTAGHRQALPPE